MLLRSPLLWYQHLININKIILILFQGKTQLSHLKGGKLKHKKNQNQRQGLCSVQSLKAPTCVLRGLNPVKTQVSLSKIKQQCLIQRLIAPRKCRKQREPAASAQPSRSTNSQLPTNLEQHPGCCLLCQAAPQQAGAGCLSQGCCGRFRLRSIHTTHRDRRGRHLSRRCHSQDHRSKYCFIRATWFLVSIRRAAFTALTQNKTQLPFLTATEMPDFNSWGVKCRQWRRGAFEIFYFTFTFW